VIPRAVRPFLALYIALYAAFGVASPFLPAFLVERGLPADALGLLLAVGIGVRMLSAPVAARLADRAHAPRLVLGACAAAAALVVLAYLPLRSRAAIIVVSLVHAVALAPTTGLADALALSASERDGFEYGWVRGAGSGAFVAGVLLSGQAVSAFGLDAILVAQATLLACTAIAAGFVSDRTGSREPKKEDARAVLMLLRSPRFRRVVLVAALVLGSHALHDGFAVIRWSKAGIGPGRVSFLWSESVIAEVLVFFVIGPQVLKRVAPASALAVAAIAGIVRWVVAAHTTDLGALALIQPLHGVTFALLHLACMRLLRIVVPGGLEATAQAIYGTVAIGGATALLTFASGTLYARFDVRAFWAMAALCAAALPLSWSLRGIRDATSGSAATGRA
jgi:MFS transporter, PPP family, 3-phenylpropionic acid transporter